MRKPPSAWVRFIQGYNEFMSSGFFQPFLDDYAQMLACPDPLLLEDFRLNQLSDSQYKEVQAHLETCPLCRTQLARLSDAILTVSPELMVQVPRNASAPADLKSFHSVRSASALSVQIGQIWTTYAELSLAGQGLPSETEQVVRAGFLRLFVVAGIGPLHLGRYQEVSLCALNELSDLATEQDLLLPAEATPFDEPLMLECGNMAPALTLHLESCLGELSPDALVQWQAWLAGQPSQARRGGKVLSPDGPHARFQALERQQLAYLAIPLQALKRLQNLSHGYLLRITPKGIQPPATQRPENPLFPNRRERQQDRILAASSSEAQALDPSLAQPSAWKQSLELAPDCLLDVWVEGANLEFYAYSSEQIPLTGLMISLPDHEGALQTLETDDLGTAFVPLHQLASGEILLTLSYGALQKFLPVQRLE